MDRYHYDLLDRAYAIFDRQRGYGDKYHPDANRLATVYDHEVAQRLVDLLNADQRSRDAAALLRREAQRLSLINQPERADALNDIAESLE